jgi:acyl-coenzyme A thioesterase PaaI-like protein
LEQELERVLHCAVAGYVQEEVPSEEIERQKALFGPFTQSVRELIDAALRTEVDDEEIRAAQGEIEALTKRLRERQIEGSYGVRFNATGESRPWGNAVVGLRNAVAPRLVIEHDITGRAWSDFHLGAAYEGPPGLVHGGVSALILDQMLGEAAGAGGKPGMTGTLTLRYRRGTPLGPLQAEAHIDRVEGAKTFAVGHIADAGGVTVEAEGVFILPRWARAAFEEKDARQVAPTRFE